MCRTDDQRWLGAGRLAGLIVLALLATVGACDEALVGGPTGDISLDTAINDVELRRTPCKSDSQCPGYGDPCKKISCVNDFCQVQDAAEGDPCDDDNSCTADTTCTAGACTGKLICECATTQDCAGKEDADLCNGSLYCNSGSCIINPATEVTCPTVLDTTCMKSTCAPDTGACSLQPANDAQPCDDGDVCSEDTVCKSGTCGDGRNLCPCKADADCADKDDGNPCNGKLYCDKTSAPYGCKVNPATVVNCTKSGDSECRKNLCDPKTSLCGMTDLPDGDACEEDGVACTADTCKGGTCVQGDIPKASADKFCTCASSADCAPLVKDKCVTQFYCNKVKGACEPNPASAVQCPALADLPCVDNACQPDTGKCLLKNVADGQACDDGKSCSAKTTCDKGVCVEPAGANGCQCAKSADCAKFEDGNVCNGTLYCDISKSKCAVNPATVVVCPAISLGQCNENACNPKDGTCSPAPVKDGTSCEADGTWCTSPDWCEKGVCQEAFPNGCPCEATADCAKWEDGNACNGSLFCDKKVKLCKVNPATVVVCKPGEGDCLPNLCDAKDGTCKPTPKADDTPCNDDGFACSVDVCKGGKCSLKKEACLCWDNADCAPFQGDLCEGKLYCDKTAGPPNCKVNPATKVSCKAWGLGDCVGEVCDPKDGACKVGPVNPGKGCDDGNKCSKGDKCDGGDCVGLSAGATLDCDDGNLCTFDACHGDKGCTYLNNSFGCNDGDVCISADKCKDGSCSGGVQKDCDDGDACTTDGCDAKTGCTHNKATGTACDDGDACTKGEACDKGSCAGGAKASCDDGDPCTDDSCDKAKGCSHAHNTGKCDDGNPCTTPDICAAGTCKPGDNTCLCKSDADCVAKEDGDLCNGTLVCAKATGKCVVDAKTVVKCPPGAPCQPQVCTPKTGKCAAKSAADGAACEDGDKCTVKDACKGGKCAATPVKCDDGKVCTDDSCNAADGKCQHKPNTAKCDDGKPCTIDDVCAAGACAGKAKPCDDGKVCTTDSCDAKTGNCKHANNTAKCDDGKPCTVDEACAGGTCGGMAKTCDDGKACTVDTCAVKTGKCSNIAKDCADSDKCTVDGCDAKTGKCTHAPINCDDKDTCTIDCCDKATGVCKHNNTQCTDGNLCTTDKCNQSTGKCLFVPVICDDKNGCTADKCDVKTGKCSFVAKVCDDGDKCTVDACDKATGKCKSAPKPCDDGDKCTKDTCDKATGGCKAAAIKCDDGNICTDDFCDAKTGKCAAKANTKACDDGDKCTTKDICKATKCAPGTPKSCDDGKMCTKDSCVPKTGLCSHAPIVGCKTEYPLPFNEPFDCGAPQSQLWTLSKPSPPTSGVAPFWAIDGKPTPPGFLSKSCSLNFNDDKDYTCPGGYSMVSGHAVSPPIKLAKPGMNLAIRFRYSGKWEKSDFDQLTLQASVDGKGWITVLAWNQLMSPGVGIWSVRSALLNNWQGTKLRLRWLFATSDCIYNEGTGPFIDDMEVVDAACAKHADCDDKNACSTDTCDAQTKLCSWKYKTCDDGKDCTDDACNKLTGKCIYKNSKDGNSCNDGDACTTADACLAGACKGKPKCDDKNPCTLDSCNKGTCGHQPTNNGKVCSDGQACTTGDVCISGDCRGKPGPCGVARKDAFNCGSMSGWVAVPKAAPKGVAWRVNDKPSPPAWLTKGCSLNVNNDINMVCGPGQKKIDFHATSPEIDLTGAKAATMQLWSWVNLYLSSMSSSNSMQALIRVSADGFKTSQDWPIPGDSMLLRRWLPLSLDISPFAGKKIRVRLHLLGGDCAGYSSGLKVWEGWFIDEFKVLTDVGKKCSKDADCEDKNLCTDDVCVQGQCGNKPNAKVCDDANPCTNTSRCYQCVCAPLSVKKCDDENNCTLDACSPSKGCINTPRPDGWSCSDNTNCTKADKCAGGKCKGILACDDNNDCTDDSCGGVNCKYVSKQQAAACSDGNPCTTNDACNNGKCQGGAPGPCTTTWFNPLNCGEASKWKMVPDAKEPAVGWHVDATANPPGFYAPSPKCSLNFNNGVDYKCPPGGKPSAGLATAVQDIDLSQAKKSAALTFMSFFDTSTSTSQDHRFVELSTDGFKTVALGRWLPNSYSLRNKWRLVTVDLSAFVGKKLQLRFRFDALFCSSLSRRGWFVDDVRVRTDQTKNCSKDADCNVADPCIGGLCLNGACSAFWSESTCDDGDPCTSKSICTYGVCSGLGLPCDDSNSCTQDACTPSGCKHTPRSDGYSCSDGNACTTFDRCTGGLCFGIPKCDDGNPCTKNGCIVGNCKFTKKATGDPCEDNNACTKDDKCTVEGVCVGAPGPCTALPPSPFDCGGDGGWTLSPKPKGLDPGWAVDGLPMPPGYYSKSCSLNYNNNTNCYGAKYGKKPTATATSPVLDLGGATKAFVSFWTWSYNSTSSTTDRRTFDISLDGFKTVASSIFLPDNTANGYKKWVRKTIDVSKWGGKKIQVRLRFDNVYCGSTNYLGWFVDDFELNTNKATACKSDKECADKSVCTDDKCISGACTHVFNKADCDDGNACSLSSACNQGSCKALLMKICKDANACTDDKCEPAKGCVFPPRYDGAYCNDSNNCTSPDRCVVGKCVGFDKCEDNNACTLDSCVGYTCKHTNTIDGGACSDGDPCTGTDKCAAGKCVGKAGPCQAVKKAAMGCSDGAQWQIAPQVKEPDVGWHLDATQAPPGYLSPACSLNFNDGNAFYCDTGKKSAAGTATWLPKIDLSKAKQASLKFFSYADVEYSHATDRRNVEVSADGFKTVLLSVQLVNSSAKMRSWHQEVIDLKAALGKVVQIRLRFDSGSCSSNSGDGWFVDDLVVLTDEPKKCANAAACNDGNVCTDDSCVAGSCQHKANTKSCEDGNKCTLGDTCVAGSCNPKPGALCNDNNDCTKDACDLVKGCQYTNWYDGKYCNDGDKCTNTDRCKAGKCLGVTFCKDNKPCTTDTCKDGQCSYPLSADGAVCDDGDACTASNLCVAGVCSKGADICTWSKPVDLSMECATKGWTIVPLVAADKIGWHFDSTPKLPKPKTGTCTLNFNNGLNYYGPSAVKGNATSPKWTLPTADVLRLRFWSYNGVDKTTYDRRYVDLTADGFKTMPISQKLDNYAAWNQWQQVSVPLAALAGKSNVQLRLRFDSVSNYGNKGPGWFVDDVVIEAGKKKVCSKASDCPDDGNPCTIDTCTKGACTYTLQQPCNLVLKAPFKEPFDCGSPNMLAWAFGDDGKGVSWNVDGLKNPPGYHSPSCSLNFNRDNNKLYCPGGVKSMMGWARTPMIDAKGMKSPRVRFRLSGRWYHYQDQDKLALQVSHDGKKWSELAPLGHPNLSWPYYKWPLRQFDLSDVAGKAFQLRFVFTRDGCAGGTYEGPFVDDLEVFDAACVADKDCDDGESCTTDKCTDKQCSWTKLANNTACDNGQPCRYNNKCREGWCDGGAATYCNDNNSCTLDKCDPATDKCAYTPSPANYNCSDGASCTSSDKCDGKGKCIGVNNCNDQSSCTTDNCNLATKKCEFKAAADGGACDDGSKCTSKTTCKAGKCAGGQQKDCDDKKACTLDSCKAATGACVNTAIPNCCKANGDCDDSDACTDDTCATGKCTYKPNNGPNCCYPKLYETAFDTAAGLTIKNSHSKVGWNVWAPAPTGNYKSPLGALYYGDPIAKNYNGGFTNGTVRLPPVTMKTDKFTVTFWYYADIETSSSYDKVELFTYLDGVKQIGNLWGPKPAAYKKWATRTAVFNTVGSKGKKLELEFKFNSVDGISNSTLGVLIDDLKIEHDGCP